MSDFVAITNFFLEKLGNIFTEAELFKGNDKNKRYQNSTIF